MFAKLLSASRLNKRIHSGLQAFFDPLRCLIEGPKTVIINIDYFSIGNFYADLVRLTKVVRVILENLVLKTSHSKGSRPALCLNLRCRKALSTFLNIQGCLAGLLCLNLRCRKALSTPQSKLNLSKLNYASTSDAARR